MRIYLALIVLSFFSCSSSKKLAGIQSTPCNENLEFKKEFFENIKNVEVYFKLTSTTDFKNFEEYEKTVTEEMKKSYENSLFFISKYSHVSYESMLNYDRSYPIGVYEKDRAEWLKWYEDNKCLNIQFKS
jgi:hypothetical protein